MNEEIPGAGSKVDLTAFRGKFRIPKVTKQLLSTLNLDAYKGPGIVLTRIERACRDAADAASDASELLSISEEARLSDEQLDELGANFGAALFELYVIFGASREVRKAMDKEFLRRALMKRGERGKRQ